MRSLVAMVCLVSFAARADCYDWNWHVFPPPGSTLPSNGRITVEAMGLAQDIVATMASRHPRLVAGEVQIPLKVVELHKGGFRLTQVVLQAKGALAEGTRYTLHFDQPDDHLRLRLNRDASPSWTVTPADFAAPVWRKGPSQWAGRYKEYGCGPAIEARVGLLLADDSATQVRARITGTDGGTHEYLLETKDEELTVGHGMCSGAFQLDDGAWSLELIAVDAAGNSKVAPGGPLLFIGINANKPDAG